MRTAIIYLSLLLGLSVHGQRNCGSHELLIEKDKTYPHLRLLDGRDASAGQRSSVNGVITIPVVVHIVYNNESENISDEQVLSQIDVLNEDFRRQNADSDDLWPQAADTEIEFCLASRDEFGDATCGITRTYTDSSKFRLKPSVKFTNSGGIDGWDETQYLNIWVCDISGLLGFATFPNDPDREEDGIVVDYLSFGRIGILKPDFNLGRTTTHEVGHWLNLRHIWGDGDCSDDDFISDTPLSDDHNYGCDAGHVSCGSLDMVQNYMDYSDDVCMNLFTLGQKERMRALFEPGGFKHSFLSSKGCDEAVVCNQVYVEISFDNYPDETSWEFLNANGQVMNQGGNYDASYVGETVTFDLGCYDDGSYTFVIYDSYGDGLCCDHRDGSYQVFTTYLSYPLRSGQFTSSDTQALVLKDKHYRFTGPGLSWDNPSNWNKLDPPSDCYEGEILIEADCEVLGMELTEGRKLSIVNGAELKIKE